MSWGVSKCERYSIRMSLYIEKILKRQALLSGNYSTGSTNCTIVVYSSAPEQAVIGEVEVVKTIKMKPTPLWNSTKANAGISRLKYREYFSGCTTAYAFALGSFKRYETSKSLADFNIQSAPQSFVYLDD